MVHFEILFGDENANLPTDFSGGKKMNTFIIARHWEGVDVFEGVIEDVYRPCFTGRFRNCWFSLEH